jgi:hypothetical protein
MDDRNIRDPNRMAADRMEDRERIVARNNTPWVVGLLVLAAIAFGALVLAPWDRPTQTTSTPPAPTQSAPPAGTTGTAPPSSPTTPR